ncbi:MAG: glycosyltransferase [Desulfitobacterium sp.]
MKLSACMIVKNEEKNLSKCISSIRDIVGEIIVVDTGSTDQTIAIAESLGAKVFRFTWINDFAAAKNYAISLAKGDWIIFLDADEYFAEGLAHNIPRLIKKIHRSFDGIACKMINIEASSGKHLIENIHVRIFRNNPKIRYVNAIHETVLNNGRNMKVALAPKDKLLIYHTGYSMSVKRSKFERNLKLLMKELKERPSDSRVYHYISDCYIGLGEWENALHYAQRFLQSGEIILGCNIQSHQNIISAMFQLGSSTDVILLAIESAIKQFPKNPIFPYYMARLLHRDKKYEIAFAAYINTLRLQEAYNDIDVNSMPSQICQAYMYMGIISEHKDEDERAMDFYLESLKYDKRNPDCFQLLFMLIRDQSPQDIILFLDTLYDKEDREDLEFLTVQLANCEEITVFSYYANLRFKKSEKFDVLTMQMLLANKHYEEIFYKLSESYQQSKDINFAILSAIVALLGDNPDHRAACLELLPSSLVKLIKTYFYIEDVVLNAEDETYYYSILSKFILWADDDSLDRLVSVSLSFEQDVSDRIGGIFFHRNYYQAALRFYEQAISNSMIDKGKLAVCHFRKGYCLYKLKNYEGAVKSFLQAYEVGYRENDIYELLRWSVKTEQEWAAISKVLGENQKYVEQAELLQYDRKTESDI